MRYAHIWLAFVLLSCSMFVQAQSPDVAELERLRSMTFREKTTPEGRAALEAALNKYPMSAPLLIYSADLYDINLFERTAAISIFQKLTAILTKNAEYHRR